MSYPNAQDPRKNKFYWIITILAWELVILMVGMAICSLTLGEMASFIGFLLIACFLLVAMFQPKWFQRFARWYTNIRGW